MIACLHFPSGGKVELGDDLRWVASDPSLEPVAEQARREMQDRSPADGYPGCVIAERLARQWDARLELADLAGKQGSPDVVY